MPDARDSDSPEGPPPHLPRRDGEDLILAAIDHLRRSESTDGKTPRKTLRPRMEESLAGWAADLDLLLDPDSFLTPFYRGGMEHDLLERDDRVYKSTRLGVFGLSPGIELALVASSQDARRFHLWEATPLEYLERLRLQNLLVPKLNSFEGIALTSPTALSIITSQPLFEKIPVTTDEIDAYFAAQGFTKITTAAYYRQEDNLGIFDAHDKNLFRAGNTLIPFDVIPCHPTDGFLKFIEDTVAAGHSLKAVRTTHTT